MSITYVNISWYPHEYRPFLGPAKGEGRHQEYSWPLAEGEWCPRWPLVSSGNRWSHHRNWPSNWPKSQIRSIRNRVFLASQVRWFFMVHVLKWGLRCGRRQSSSRMDFGLHVFCVGMGGLPTKHGLLSRKLCGFSNEHRNSTTQHLRFCQHVDLGRHPQQECPDRSGSDLVAIKPPVGSMVHPMVAPGSIPFRDSQVFLGRRLADLADLAVIPCDPQMENDGLPWIPRNLMIYGIPYDSMFLGMALVLYLNWLHKDKDDLW